MRLTRAARRPLDFPNIAQAFNGTAQDKRELLRKFLSAGENLQDLEAHFTAERSVEDQTEEVTEAMTVRQMREAGFSERPGQISIGIPCTLLCQFVSFVRLP